MAALRLLANLEQAARPALPEEQAVLARWSGWGAVPAVFDEADDRYAVARAELLRALVDDDEWAAAQRTTLNAHYTDPAVVTAMWDGVAQMGFTSGRVLEPGCGSGNFIGFAEGRGAEIIGVERDPTSAQIAQALYPDADIHNVKFQRFDLAEPVDAVIGNVPFAEPLRSTLATTAASTGPAEVAYLKSTNGVPCPLGWVVAEHDAVRVEAVQLLQRGRSFCLIPSVVIEVRFLERCRAPGGLAAHDRGGVVALDHDRLVSWCVRPGVAITQTPLAMSWSPSITVRSMLTGNAHSGTV